MSTFASALPAVTPLDPTKHVKFTRGMVLGVDDFDQEFAYLSGRDRWIVRDLLGYGVVSGLRLSAEPPPAGEEDKGPRINVSAGVAALPSGQLVCVSPAQCAFVGDWVRANVDELELGQESPPADVRAAVVLCYAECESEDVPIPGEPCRSEDSLMAPSRIEDHFSLELRTEAPPHLEDEAVRRFVAWLDAVPVTEDGTDLDDFLFELREAGSEPAGSPPSTVEFLDEPPPPGLAIPRARLHEYLESAFGLWATELRARWRTLVPGCECAPGPDCPPDDACLLLGELVIPVTWDSLAGEVVVGGADEIELDLARRPTLLHLRLLQEWLLARRGGRESISAVVRVDASPPQVIGDGLDVVPVDERLFHLIPNGFDPAATYAVTATAIAAFEESPPAAPVPTVVELLDPQDPALETFLAGEGIGEPGLTVRVQTVAGDPPSRGFSVTVERVGGGS
jgi:hypothetical protein